METWKSNDIMCETINKTVCYAVDWCTKPLLWTPVRLEATVYVAQALRKPTPTERNSMGWSSFKEGGSES
jgi:hypothetical protein